MLFKMRSSISGLKGGGVKAAFLVATVCSLLRQVMAEEGPSDSAVSMSATLIGAISFIMCLYYFVNYDDTDIRQNSWEIISMTISIFCAVLFFSTFNDLVESNVIDPIFGKGDATKGALLVDMLHMLVWFGIMQMLLACMSGAVTFPGCSDLDEKLKVTEKEMEQLEETDGELFEEVEEAKEGKEGNMKCYAVLCAHITGFAANNAFGTLQAVYFSSSPYAAALTPVVALFSMLCLQRLMDNIRESVSKGDDNKTDVFEALWDEECEEAENDVMGLALSFTTVGALRFLITGCLPNQEGKEEECKVEEYLYHHTSSQKMMLFCSGLAFAALIFLMRSKWPESLEEEAIHELPKSKRHNMKLLSRLCEGLYVTVSMCFAWCFFYSGQMVLAGYAPKGEEELLAVMNAMVLSVTCMFLIIPLDWLADQSWTDDKTDNAIRSIMNSMGLLIGFGWEQCFDASVDVLATKAGNHGIINVHTTKLALTLFCAGLLIPAWKWYMIPFMIKEGWQADYPMRMAIHTAKHISIEGSEEDLKDAAKALNSLRKQAKKMAALMEGEETIKKLKKVESAVAGGPAGQDAEAPAYKELAAAPDDAASLKKENADLRNRLKQAESDKTKAQQLLDATMNEMLKSMKTMHATVERIENSG
jgi:hypothetical protein